MLFWKFLWGWDWEKNQKPVADFGFMGKPDREMKNGKLVGGRHGETWGGQNVTSWYNQDDWPSWWFHDLAADQYLKVDAMNLPKKEERAWKDRLFELFHKKPKPEDILNNTN